MGYLNRVQLIGNLGADPDMRYTPSNRPVCNMSLATSETWKDKEGEKKERTEWHRLQAWGDLAETCAKYLSKGKQVYVEGKLQTRKWQDKEGKDRYTTEIVVDKVVFLGSANSGGRSGDECQGGHENPPDNRGKPAQHREEHHPAPPQDDDIPF